jgi:hypothetical protein
VHADKLARQCGQHTWIGHDVSEDQEIGVAKRLVCEISGHGGYLRPRRQRWLNSRRRVLAVVQSHVRPAVDLPNPIILHAPGTSCSSPSLLGVRQLPLLDVGAGGIFDGRVGVGAHRGRLYFLAAAIAEPRHPIGPPGAVVFGGVLKPLVRPIGFLRRLVGPEAAFFSGRRVDDASDMAAGGKDKAGVGVGATVNLSR